MITRLLTSLDQSSSSSLQTILLVVWSMASLVFRKIRGKDRTSFWSGFHSLNKILADVSQSHEAAASTPILTTAAHTEFDDQ